MVLAKNSTNKHQKPIKAVIFVTSKNRSSTMLRGCSFVTALSTLAIPLWDNEILRGPKTYALYCYGRIGPWRIFYF